MDSIVTCCKLHDPIAYIGDPLAEYGSKCPLCAAIAAARKFKEAQHSGGVTGGQGTANKSSLTCLCNWEIDSDGNGGIVQYSKLCSIHGRFVMKV